MHGPAWRAGLVLAALLVAVLLAAQLARSAGSTQDDAFITYRYAAHLAAGEGLVYNPGERVEGYTNFLWTLVIAGVIAAGGDPVVITPWLGALCTVGVALLLILGARRDTRRSRDPSALESRGAISGWGAGLCAALFYASGSAVAAEGVQGLETPFFALLVTGALLQDAREREDGRPRGGWSGLLYALAALTRPEGVMLFLMAVLLRGFELVRGRSGPARVAPRGSELRWAATAAVPIALHLLFRLVYYGDVVPNTAHAKVSFSAAILARGLVYLGSFLLTYAPIVILAGAGVFLEWEGQRTRLLAAWALLDMAYVSWVGGDYKPTFRFFAAVIPVLCLLAGRGLVLLIEAIPARVVHLGALLGGAGALAAFLWFASAPARQFTDWRRSLLPVHTSAGRWMKASFPPTTLVATINAGVVPYYSGLPTIDMLGLCDKVIARRPASQDSPDMAGHEKGDGAYVLSRRPDVILFMQARFSTRPVPEPELERLAWGVSETEILRSDTLRRDYAWTSVQLPGFFFNYYKRR